MTTVESFINRLKKIGIEVELSSNYPWIYMTKVNGIRIHERFEGNHGFTVFFLAVRLNDPHKQKITNIPIIFNKIREVLKYGYDPHREEDEDYGC